MVQKISSSVSFGLCLIAVELTIGANHVDDN